MFRVACFSSQVSVRVGHRDGGVAHHHAEFKLVTDDRQLQPERRISAAVDQMFRNKRQACDSPVLFLYSMSYEVMTLFPSNLCVQRRFMLRSLTSRTSNSGGSGGSEDE